MWRDAGEGEDTELETGEHGPKVAVRGFELTILETAQAGRSWTSTTGGCAIGSHASNDLVLEDRTISRFHCEIRPDSKGARLRDLGSRNGTTVDGVKVADAWLKNGSTIKLGSNVSLRFRFAEQDVPLPLSDNNELGGLTGQSVSMRACFALLERAAASGSTVLLEGETGSGKEEAAIAIHEASARADKPFVVVDCSAIPDNLLESELFGHEQGAFTGAVTSREGAFQAASGGTVFLDEIGEVATHLQPKLLRVLEARTVRRVGGNDQKPVDIRVITATNRNLRAEVNEGRFRSDLYYRLAVVKIAMPPLRERPEDIPLLSTKILTSLGADRTTALGLLTPELISRLQRAAWPGNVRELRNYLEQCLVLHHAPPLPDAPRSAEGATAVDPLLSYAEAKRLASEDFERRYLRALLDHHQGNVSESARASGVSRVYLHRLLRRHGLR